MKTSLWEVHGVGGRDRILLRVPFGTDSNFAARHLAERYSLIGWAGMDLIITEEQAQNTAGDGQ